MNEEKVEKLFIEFIRYLDFKIKKEYDENGDGEMVCVDETLEIYYLGDKIHELEI